MSWYLPRMAAPLTFVFLFFFLACASPVQPDELRAHSVNRAQLEDDEFWDDWRERSPDSRRNSASGRLHPHSGRRSSGGGTHDLSGSAGHRRGSSGSQSHSGRKGRVVSPSHGSRLQTISSHRVAHAHASLGSNSAPTRRRRPSLLGAISSDDDTSGGLEVFLEHDETPVGPATGTPFYSG